LSFAGTGTRAIDDSLFLEDVAVSSSEPGEEGSSSLALLLITREAVQLIELFSCTNTQTVQLQNQAKFG
jgi:hypothetical protein